MPRAAPKRALLTAWPREGLARWLDAHNRREATADSLVLASLGARL